MTLLVRHPVTPPGAIHTVDAELVRTPDGVTAIFRAIGDIAQLAIPEAKPAERMDDLWKTTCFELFVAGAGESYREYNLSPSTRWAAYDFDRFRDGMRNAPADIRIDCSSDSKALTLIAKIRTEMPNPARIGLSAIIEERDGKLRYWAVAFAPGEPDFHADETRALLLDGVDAQ